MSKLTDDQVREIRASTEQGQRLAARFGVSGCTISLVRRRKSYAHVLDADDAARQKRRHRAAEILHIRDHEYLPLQFLWALVRYGHMACEAGIGRDAVFRETSHFMTEEGQPPTPLPRPTPNAEEYFLLSDPLRELVDEINAYIEVEEALVPA